MYKVTITNLDDNSIVGEYTRPDNVVEWHLDTARRTGCKVFIPFGNNDALSHLTYVEQYDASKGTVFRVVYEKMGQK